MSYRLKKFKTLRKLKIQNSTELHKWSENMINVENCQFLKVNCKFFFSYHIWVKWKQPECFITPPYSSTFYSLFLPFFVLEIFKFMYDKFFGRHSASISKFKWFEQLKADCQFSETLAPVKMIGLGTKKVCLP